MQKIKIYSATILLIFLVCSHVLAHAPREVSLSYGDDDEVVVIEIVHSSGDPARHYVDRVDVFLNDEQIGSESPEATNDPIITVPLSEFGIESGDIIAVRVYCNRGGDLYAQITVGE
jgi:hypothetical protein